MNKMQEFVQHSAEAPTPAMKAVNYVAAILAGGSFLGFVNLAVGVLSALWLTAQLYGFIKYEIPRRREQREITAMEKEIRRRELERMKTKPGDLCD